MERDCKNRVSPAIGKRESAMKPYMQGAAGRKTTNVKRESIHLVTHRYCQVRYRSCG